ncbi:MAG: acyl-CoA dehydrogenase [Deltaproteobacteria bacterium]|nr:acyl-CoA dehydrogenase [Deltaproteobacteria bacterium]
MEFRYDTRDLRFIIKEWLPTEEVFACDRFKNYFSVDDVDMYLNEGYKVARGIINPINVNGDRIGIKFEKGVATSPPGFKEAYKFLQENGWGSSAECVELEGGMPLILYKMIHEMNTAACPALTSYIKLTSGSANLIIRFGRKQDRELFVPKMVGGEWQGTMCITEPNAGSDIGDATSQAFPTDDPDIWMIKGTKMFITAGDLGICDNTIHMVLARPEGGTPGSAGLGLYIVPKIWVNPDGSLGEANDVTTVSVEHKMGLKAQATCMLSFGDNDRCRGIRVGPLPDAKGRSKGLAMMFHMMNESRIGTGHNANCQSAAAYYFASQFTTERIQGRPFGESPDAARVPIIKHEDVRRMLLDMKAHIEGIRAMIFRGFYWLDVQGNSSDKEKAKRCGEMAEVLTPLVKGYGSEASVGLIAEAIQVLGGVGYTQEYPIEQYLRDSKILSIWEGTTFIHGMDLVRRKMRMDGGAPFTAWMELIADFIEKNKNTAGLEKEMEKLANGLQCIETVRELYDCWYGNLDAKKHLIPLNAVNALFVCAQVQVAECLLEQAVIALKQLDGMAADHHDAAFYRGKVAAAKYYVNQVLPKAFMLTDLIKSEETSVLECPEEALVVR